MIEFVTLFLILTWGERPVEVAVGTDVAAVELRLDGEAVGRMTAPPWRLEVDFGEPLVPHVLEAVARDGEGRTVGKARRTINFGRSAAEASLILDLTGSPVPRRARILWQSFDHSQPKKMRARFDGRKVAVDEDGGIELPPYDPLAPHLLEAKLTFPDSLVAEAELSFGGAYSEQLSSALVAVPVLFPAAAEPPAAAAMTPWFRAGDQPATVFSVERRPGVVYVVRDLNLPSPLPAATPEAKPGGLPAPALGTRKISPHEIRFIATTPHISDSGPRRTAIFLIAKVEEAWNRKGLLEVARYLAPADHQRRRQQLLEAVALAARAAAAGGRPRAVLLLVSADSADASLLSVAQTLGYLESLRVPLFVWRAPGDTSEPAAGVLADGELAELAGRDLEAVVGAVHQSLASQAVVWFEGSWLPHQIEVTAAAPAGVRFPF